MGIGYNPRTITDGLVFYIDMMNSAKSWKGAPTTNLANGKIFNGNNNFTVNTNVVDTMPDKSIGIARELNAQFVSDANRTVSIGSFSLTAGLTYTLSFYAKNINCSGFGGNLYSSTLSRVIDYITYPSINTTSWTRVIKTFTVPDEGFNPVILDPQAFRDAGYGLFRLCWLMLENSSFASAYTPTSRNNTQNIIDLTGNYAITATNLNYNSDNTYSFFTNSVANYMDISSNSLISGTNPFTVEAFFTNDTGSGCILGNYGVGNTSNTFWLYAGGMYLNVNNYISNPGPRINGTHCICVSRDVSGNVKVYFDGVLDSTYTNTTSINAGQNFRIGADVNGAGEPFKGNIYSIKVYNRVLSDSECAANYNALKSRYGK